MSQAAPAQQKPAAEAKPLTELEKILSRPLRTWGDADRMRLIAEDPQRAARMLQALVEANTLEIPDTVFSLRENGIVKKVTVAVTLKESDGHINSVGGGNFMVSAAGYRKLNQVASIQIVAPDSISVEDKRQPNPYVQLDPDSRTPCAVYCRKIAIGASPMTGALVATDVMLRFDLNIYLLESIVSKIKQESSKQEGQPDAIGFVGLPGGRPDGDGTWMFIKMSDIGGGVGYWVNLKSYQVRLAMQEHVTRMKFAERVAQTMAERNALKAHPAMPAVISVGQNKVAVVRMIGWRTDFDQKQLAHIRELAQENRIHEIAQGGVTTLRLDNSNLDDADRGDVDRTVDDEAAEERRQQGDGDDEAPRPEGEDQRPADERPAPPDLIAQILKARQRLIDVKGAKAARAALAACGIERPEECTIDQAQRFIAAAEKESK